MKLSDLSGIRGLLDDLRLSSILTHNSLCTNLTFINEKLLKANIPYRVQAGTVVLYKVKVPDSKYSDSPSHPTVCLEFVYDGKEWWLSSYNRQVQLHVTGSFDLVMILPEAAKSHYLRMFAESSEREFKLHFDYSNSKEMQEKPTC